MSQEFYCLKEHCYVMMREALVDLRRAYKTLNPI